MRPGRLTRRQFLVHSSASLAAIQIVPGAVLGLQGATPPNSRLQIACIGVAGRGAANLSGVRGESVVALCDVDTARMASARSAHPQAKTFQDYRALLDQMGPSIDAVTISTPDHTHAAVAMDAIRRGKHVYCEKPLAHSIHEVRQLVQAARRHRVVTQLGNQGHSSDTIRTFREWIQDGAIGNVHTIHAASSANHCKIDQLPLLREKHPVPDSLDWDLWLGPAQHRPYHPAYLPGKWRGWMPFGCGAIGDWVCHVVDPSFWALDLGSPIAIRAEARNYDPVRHADTFPAGSVVTFEFPARGSRGPVRLVWHDGVEKLPRPAELDPDDQVPTTGAIVIGDRGAILHGSHGAGGLRLIPDAKMDAYRRPPKTLPRVPGHHADWLDAIRKGGSPGSRFDYGGPLTEIALLGIIAIRCLGTRLEWDGAAGRFTNHPPANQLLRPEFRPGWGL